MPSRRGFGAYSVGSAMGLTNTASPAQPAGGARVPTTAGRKPRVGVLLPVPRNDHFLVVLRERLRDAG